MPNITFDRYYRYADLTQLLQAYAQEYPHLVHLQSIGKSYEGRDIWLVTVTAIENGVPEDKPALWVDGNIHASEVSASSACLYLLHKLTTHYGQDADITRCLNTRAFYICPRINPDGAELALADKPYIIRSSTRPYPYNEEPLPGFVEEDMDEDGRVLQMRIPDPQGEWKKHPDDPRLMIPREPTEVGGEYFRILPEGHINNFDGITIQYQKKKEGLDLNRNFPYLWRQENEQRGAGLYPTSEPEVHTIVEFMTRHANITGAITFHTFSGVLLRPYGHQADDKFPAEDLWTYKKIGAQGKKITGYPDISVYHDFQYKPNTFISGVFDDWAYEHLGVYAWTVEIWSPQRQAGIEEYKYIDWYREHPIEDDFKMLKWSDEKLDGQGYVTWYPFEHPQFGPIEIGGWNMQYAWRNPPPQFLEQEIAPFADWVMWHLLISPRLELFKTEVTSLGDNFYHILVAVHNTGWLPTYITKKAVEKKVVRGVIAEIALPDGASLKTGKTRLELGELEGRAYNPTGLGIWSATGFTDERAKAEWVVYAPHEGIATVTIKHERAGVVRFEAELKA